MSDYFSTKSTSTDKWLGSKVTGDDPDKWRFVVEADGKIRWAQGGPSNSDVILQRSNFSQLNPSDPQYWAFPLLTLYRGDGTTAGDLQLGTIKLKDSGTIIKWYPDFHTELDIKPGFEPTGYRTHLYCTTVNPNDRRTGPLDPMLTTDYAFFVEKDFKTFGFVGTSSDPEKGMGGGAIQMGQGFTGKNCPPMFNLTGTMTIPDDATAQQLYNHGTTLPGTGNERDIFYNTTDQTIYQYGVTGSGWRPISTAGKIDGYPRGITLPPSGEYEQWFYKINADQPNQLYQYTKNDAGIYAWRLRFNNVQSYDYDTLFLMRADYEHLGDPIRPANLHLGGLTATNAIYVDQIKHLDGSNWNINGFDQSLNTTNDAVFNSVKVISADGNPAHGATVKVGDSTHDYIALNYDATYGYVSAHNRALYLSGDNGITFGSNINFNNKTFSNYLGSLGSGTPSSNTYLRGDGIWATLPAQQWTAGSVSSVSAPLTISSNALTMPQANGSTNGYLNSTDWNTFNNKYGSGSTPTFNGININGNIIPTIAGTPSTGHYCGSNTYPWKMTNTYYLYTNTINALTGNTVNIACTLAFGSNPFTISSTSTIANLNADLLDGYHASSFVTSGSAPSLSGLSIGGNIIPTSASSYYCGSNSLPWQIVNTQHLYANNLNALSGSTITISPRINLTQPQDQIQFSPSGYNSTIWAYKPSESKLFGIWDGSSWKFYIDTSGNLQCTCNIYPASANNGNIGTNTNYWGSMWTNYLRYKNISAFDAYDDLTLAKNYKIMTITEDGIEKEVIDPESLPFLKAESKEPFFDNGKTTGFLLGCVKALVQRIEALENQLNSQTAL